MIRENVKGTDGLIRNGKIYYLRKSFHGKQIEVSLLTDCKSTAKTRAARFIATARENGVETAMTELHGKPVLKKGEDPSFDQMAELYRSFCKQSASPPRAPTIEHNIGCLRRLMAKFPTVSAISHEQLVADFRGNTRSEKRSFASQVGNASSIFKKSALKYYHSKGVRVQHPFAGLEIVRPKVEAYTPLSKEQREAIWNGIDGDLPPVDAMIVLLALAAGLRRSEIEAAQQDWFTVQNDAVAVSVKETEAYVPKNGEKRIVSLSPPLYEKLLHLRERAVCELSQVSETRAALRESAFFVPVIQRKGKGGRLWRRFRSVAQWLKGHGVRDRKPLHALRKEFGSLVASEYGIFAACQLLGHSDVRVTHVHYAAVVEMPKLDISALIKSTF